MKFIQDHFQMGNFNCTPVEVKEAKMFTFYFVKRFYFAYGQWPNILCFCFTKAEWAGNFAICSLEVDIHVSIISFRCPYELLLLNCGHLQVNHRCLCDWAPIRQQPCCDTCLFIKGWYTSQKKGNKSMFCLCLWVFLLILAVKEKIAIRYLIDIYCSDKCKESITNYILLPEVKMLLFMQVI